VTYVLSLPHLFDAVLARFALDGTAVPMAFGWREPGQQRVGNRIVWVPGDPSGELGAMLPAKYPGGNPRALATLEELFTVEISGADVSAGQQENERAQYIATRLLYDAFIRALYLAAHGTYRVVKVSWITLKKERRYGAAIRAVIALQAPIADVARTVAPVDTGASIDLHELDVTENIAVSATPDE